MTDLQLVAKRLVVDYYNQNVPGDNAELLPEQVFVVWFSKNLQNWKAVLGTTLRDGIRYEISYNGDEDETYFDVYKKLDHVDVAGTTFKKPARWPQFRVHEPLLRMVR